ncbi:MAG: hypothetical protein IKA96_01120 [Alistipes sp.]|nr:hypothetical protein [Alistipes sp.]
MKRERIKSVMSIVLCSIVAMLAMPNMLSAKTYYSNKTKSKIVEEEHHWQKKFNQLINKEIKDGLKLISYELIGKISTDKQKEAFIKKCLNEKAYVMYNNDNKLRSYEVATIKEIKKNNSQLYELFTIHIESSTSRIKPNEAEIVCLTWEYNGKQFKSYAAVTDTFREFSNGQTYPDTDCVIFDNMLMPIRLKESTKNTIAYRTL